VFGSFAISFFAAEKAMEISDIAFISLRPSHFSSVAGKNLKTNLKLFSAFERRQTFKQQHERT
jgi:hypothetical protein